MTALKMAGKEFTRGVGRLIGHVTVLAVGIALMVLGLALGVTLVLLPFGLPIGLAGVLIFSWGLIGRVQENRAAAGALPDLEKKPGAD